MGGKVEGEQAQTQNQSNVILEDAKNVGSKALSGLKSGVQNIMASSSNPNVCMFHIGFKLAAIICYIFLGMLSSDKVIMYIIVITLCAFDFWTVKNVTGRLLVGLRW